MSKRAMLLFPLIFTVLLIGCTNSNNEIINEVDSPDGKYTAVYFMRDLGATTKESYQLSLLQKGKKLGDSVGNIFVTYEEFEIYWQDDEILVVKINKNEQIFKQLTQYKEVNIKYEGD